MRQNGIFPISFFVAGFALSSPAISATFDKEALAKCMITNTNENTERLFRDYLVAVLTHRKADVDRMALDLGLEILNTVKQKCNIPASAIDDPVVDEAMHEFGNHLGAKVLEDAFKNLK